MHFSEVNESLTCRLEYLEKTILLLINENNLQTGGQVDFNSLERVTTEEPLRRREMGNPALSPPREQQDSETSKEDDGSRIKVDKQPL